MEKRKVVKTGGSTYIVSLPKSWVNLVGIRAGDEIGITEQGNGSLILDPSGNEVVQRTSITLAIGEYEDFLELERGVISKYLEGYSEIILKSKKPIGGQTIKACRQITEKLTGIEFVDSDTNSLVLKDLLDPMELSIKKAFSRAATLTKLMVRNSYAVFEDNNEELAKDIIYWNEEVSKFYLLMSRQIRMGSKNPMLAKKIGMESELYPLFIYSIATAIRDIGKLMKEMMEVFLKMDVRSRSSVFKIWGAQVGGENISTFYDEVIKAALTKNGKLANKLIKRLTDSNKTMNATMMLHLESRNPNPDVYQILSKGSLIMRLCKKICIETSLNA